MIYETKNWVKPITNDIWNFFKKSLKEQHVDQDELVALSGKLPDNMPLSSRMGLIYAISLYETDIINHPDKAYKEFQSLITGLYKACNTAWDMVVQAKTKSDDSAAFKYLVDTIASESKTIRQGNELHANVVSIFSTCFVDMFEYMYRQYKDEKNKAA